MFNASDLSYSSLLNETCNIREVEYRYSLKKIWCFNISVVVTPVNPAGNGTYTTALHPGAVSSMSIVIILNGALMVLIPVEPSFQSSRRDNDMAYFMMVIYYIVSTINLQWDGGGGVGELAPGLNQGPNV